MRKLFFVALAVLVVRLLPRGIRREATVLKLMVLLVEFLATMLSVPPTNNTSKTYAVEQRTGALETRAGVIEANAVVPQTSPGNATNSSYGPSDGSTTASNNSSQSGNNAYQQSGINVTWNPQSSGNDGGDNSSTSGQIGGAAAHTHSMTHTHASSTTLDDGFNTLVTSHGALCSAFNGHITDYGNAINTLNTLKNSHTALVATVAALRTDHSNLITSHNVLVSTITTSKLFH